MNQSTLQILNVLLFVVHNLLIGFNIVGWIWERTRVWHLLTMGATLFSWIVMGAWKGWGYCLCADIHFSIRRELGVHAGERSYTELLFNQIPGVQVTTAFADIVTVGTLIAILIAMSIVWWRHFAVRRLQSVNTKRDPETDTGN